MKNETSTEVLVVRRRSPLGSRVELGTAQMFVAFATQIDGRGELVVI